jgi:NAD(P)-dependent dehydrogenase (short-subunit alcohol dehydrogenase family)
LACVERLIADGGYRVFCAGRSQPARPVLGATYVPMDVTCDVSIEQAIAQVHAQVGQLDLLVHSAGYALAGAIEDTALDEAKKQFETNFWGVVRVNRAVLPAMRAAGRGTIINIGSLAGLIPLPFQVYYSASKFALESFCEALRFEVAEFGIQVCLVEPGDLNTPLTANRQVARASGPDSLYWSTFTGCLESMTKSERAGQSADKVAAVVVRLASQRKPPLRTRVTKPLEESALWLRRLGWYGIYDRVAKRAFRLP